ncbi:MAG: hypothetical protein ACLR0U_22090 [Enterocloster clostridioformis]
MVKNTDMSLDNWCEWVLLNDRESGLDGSETDVEAMRQAISRREPLICWQPCMERGAMFTAPYLPNTRMGGCPASCPTAYWTMRLQTLGCAGLAGRWAVV